MALAAWLPELSFRSQELAKLQSGNSQVDLVEPEVPTVALRGMMAPAAAL